MRKLSFLVVVAITLCASTVFAQDYSHGEVGAFADYVRLHNANNANFLGLGGRVGFNFNKHVGLEAEMSYDFERAFANVSSGGGSTNVQRSGLRLWHGLFGPKLQTGTGAWRLFVTAKGGFLNFSTSHNSPQAGFTSAVTGFGSGDTNGVFYPAGGVEAFAGPIGLRAEIGDLMYFDRGANHNLRVTFGPQFRF